MKLCSPSIYLAQEFHNFSNKAMACAVAVVACRGARVVNVSNTCLYPPMNYQGLCRFSYSGTRRTAESDVGVMSQSYSLYCCTLRPMHHATLLHKAMLCTYNSWCSSAAAGVRVRPQVTTKLKVIDMTWGQTLALWTKLYYFYLLI